MCEPTTLLIAATVATAASAAIGGYANYQAGKQAEGAARVNQEYERRAERDAMERGSKEEIAHYRKLAALRGEQMARLSGAGLDVSFGTPADVITDTNVLGAADADIIRENALREAEGHRISASNYGVQASSAAFQTKLGVATTALDVGTTLLGGFAKSRAMSPIVTGGGKMNQLAKVGGKY